jgi:hypothetical protein
MIWKKYEMSKTKWVELSATIKNEESWDSSKVVAVVELGKLVKTSAVLDEERQRHHRSCPLYQAIR